MSTDSLMVSKKNIIYRRGVCILKVMMISGNPLDNSYGGVNAHTDNLIKFLSAVKDDLSLYSISFHSKTDRFEKNGIKFIYLRRMKHAKMLFLLELVIDFFRIKREIKKINPDVIHIQSTMPLFSLLSIYFYRLYPTILTLHGFFGEEYKYHQPMNKIFFKFFCNPLERIALKKVKDIIVVCPQIGELIKKFSSSNLHVVPNGVDIEFVKKTKSYANHKQKIIFYIGVLTKRKGVSDLIRAFSLVKKEIDNVKLFIAGKGEAQKDLERKVKELNLKDNVTFLGFISEEEKFSYIKASDVFVLPSYWESFPVVLPEVMACEKPIIATNIAGNPFAVHHGENGFLFNPGDCEDLSQKLILLLNNQEMSNKFGIKSKNMSFKFDWSVIAKQTMEIYKDIYNRRDNLKYS